MNNNQQFSILSLDGGGCWALIQVRCLQKLFGNQTRGREIIGKFDLVAGNSGGSIVLAALAENLQLDEIANLFLDKTIRRKIFARYHTIWRPFYWIVGLGPRYSTSGKLDALNELLPKTSRTPIFDLPNLIEGAGGKGTHFFVSSFDYNRQRATFFRSNKKSFGINGNLAAQLGIRGLGDAPQVTLTEAAHASSTAPVNYFNEPAKLENCASFFWDGGVAGYNNPLLAATVECIINGVKPDSMFVLSVGTGTTVLPINDRKSKAVNEDLFLKLKTKEGLFSDVRKMAKSILAAPPDAASYIAYTFLHPDHASNPSSKCDKFVRANPQLQPLFVDEQWTLPLGLTMEDFITLKTLDMDAIKDREIDLIEKFCSCWLNDFIPNQPIRMDTNLVCLIGQENFSDVKYLVNKYVS